MADSGKSIKVVDRRMFTADGEIRDEILEELEAASPASEAKPESPPPEPPVPTSPAFLRLLDMLAQTASLYLEGIPDPATGRRSVDLNAARQIVDSLMALRDKTRGRLSFEESDSLEGLLGELQMVFARLTQQVPRAAAVPIPGKPKRG